jgi:hypothetical protein
VHHHFFAFNSFANLDESFLFDFQPFKHLISAKLKRFFVSAWLFASGIASPTQEKRIMTGWFNFA